MGAPLIKTRTVLVLNDYSAAYVAGERIMLATFATSVEDAADDPTRAMSVTVRGDVFIDMGSPETITVTIEPGDRLNDEEE